MTERTKRTQNRTNLGLANAAADKDLIYSAVRDSRRNETTDFFSPINAGNNALNISHQQMQTKTVHSAMNAVSDSRQAPPKGIGIKS